MKAVRQTKYGPPDVLTIEEVEQPIPQDRQVLVRVEAVSINAGDYRGMRGTPFLLRLLTGGLTRPKDPRVGSDVAGRVEAIGENVTRFRPGDEVFGCAKGSFAEYVLAREAYLTPKPANRTYEEAAAVPVAGLTALQAIHHAGGIQLGQKVLVQGASGGVGIYALQIAKSYGAEVTAVCSPRNLEMARSLGADHVIDYTREDFTRSGQVYDLILAINGYHWIYAYRRALSPNGVYVCAGGALAQFFQAILLGPWISRNSSQKLVSMGIAKVDQDDLATLADLLEAGTIAPLIDHSYELSQVVEAVRYVDETHAQGKVVLRNNLTF